MKLTNQKVMESIQALQSLFAQKMPVKVAFSISKTIRAVNEIAAIFEETKNKIVKESAALDESGNPIIRAGIPQIADEAAFMAQVTELLSQEVEINIDTVKLDDLSAIELEPSVFYLLDWLIVE